MGRDYFLRIPHDFFERNDVVIIEGMRDGKSVLYAYLKIMFESIETSGVIDKRISKIAELTGISERELMYAIPILRYYGLVSDFSETEYKIKDVYRDVISTREDSDRNRNSSEYRAWRMAVFDRDKYTCQFCLRSGVPIEAHHIVRWVDSEESRFDVSNGITLCKDCHKMVHRKRGKHG